MELTPAQLRKIFEMYGIGAKACSPTIADVQDWDEDVIWQIDHDRVYTSSSENGFCEWQFNDCRLQLYPLEKITDADAIQLVKLRSDIFLNITIQDQWRNGKKFGFQFEFQYASSKRRRIDTVNWSGLSPLQTQYMIQRGYAAPLFIDINHPHNGSTAIDIAVAIERF